MAEVNNPSKTDTTTIENAQLHSAEQFSTQGEKTATYDPDDIHQAALVENPVLAERPNWTTILSIGFIGLSVVAPISCGFIVASSVLYTIGLDLGNLDDLGWMITGWSIASSVAFSLAGSLSDIFGRRSVIMLGQLISLIASIICSVAPDLRVLIVGSTLLGLSAGLVLVAFAAVPEIVPNKYRGLALGWIEFALAIPWVALAFLLGALLVSHATWRWIYYICIIYSAVSLAGTAVFYFPPSNGSPDQTTRSRLQQLGQLDYVGIIIYAGSLTAFLLGLSWGGSPGHAWSSASVVAPIVLGAVGLITAFAYDFTIAEKLGRHALFPRGLMTRFREFTVALVVLFVAGMVYYPMSAILPQATRVVFTSDPLQVGIILLPNGLGQACGITASLFLHKTGHPKIYIVTAIFIQTLATALYAYGIGDHKAAWMAFQFFGAGTFGLITIFVVFNTSLHVRPSELGIATGLQGTFRSMGGSVGNAVFSTIARSVAATQLPKQIAAAALEQGYKGDIQTLVGAVIEAGNGIPDAFESVKGITPSLEAATLAAFRHAYSDVYRMVFFSTIPFGVIAIIAAVLIRDSTKYMTNHTHVHIKEVVLRKHGQ